jgi:hypothetical protein
VKVQRRSNLKHRAERSQDKYSQIAFLHVSVQIYLYYREPGNSIIQILQLEARIFYNYSVICVQILQLGPRAMTSYTARGIVHLAYAS